MSPTFASQRRPAALTALLLPFACLALSACGSSSSSSSSSTATVTSSASATTTPKAGAQAGKGFSALRECLQKDGVTPPKRTPGQAPSGGPLGGASGGAQLPKGVTRAQYQAAIKRCGGLPGGRFGAGGAGGRLKSPAFTQALVRFAACMRENGVNVAQPNTSGKGPIFDTRGLNPTSAKFKAAETKCSSALRGAFRARPGTTAPPASAG